MFSVVHLRDGFGTDGIGHYIQTPEGELLAVYDEERDADIHVAILNFGLKVEAIEE
jgi:hypothetical protein